MGGSGGGALGRRACALGLPGSILAQRSSLGFWTGPARHGVAGEGGPHLRGTQNRRGCSVSGLARVPRAPSRSPPPLPTKPDRWPLPGSAGNRCQVLGLPLSALGAFGSISPGQCLSLSPPLRPPAPTPHLREGTAQTPTSSVLMSCSGGLRLVLSAPCGGGRPSPSLLLWVSVFSVATALGASGASPPMGPGAAGPLALPGGACGRKEEE